MKRRGYEKIAQLELNDRCDGTDTVGDLAKDLKRTSNYLKKELKGCTYSPSEAVRLLIKDNLGISLKVHDDHFKDAKRAYKEDK